MDILSDTQAKSHTKKKKKIDKIKKGNLKKKNRISSDSNTEQHHKD